ncbi:C-type lectin domain family 3 member A-like [Saccostrea cucullata]|uniref:C-type lectin domain family 3 member A-like n=1 Tax=Saccostrea cuccullata TaxID=36930 RepID=UPI002ED1489C
MNFLSSETMSKGNVYWIGVTDMVLEHSWVYASSLSSMTVQNWNPGEPNGVLDQNCAFLHTHGKLVDHICDTSYRFVCEMENVYQITSPVG